MRLHASQVARLRARTLTVLGLTPAAIAIAACHEPGPGPVVADSTPVASAAPVTVDASAPSTTATTDRDAATTGSAPTVDAGLAPLASVPMLVPPLPSCPSGDFCEPAAKQKKPSAKEAAPAPYGRCWATSPNPGERSGKTHSGGRVVNFSEKLTQAAREKDPDVCCYTWWVPCPGGRALRDAHGDVHLADAAPRRDWIDDALAVDSVRDDALAATWAADAAFEHASVASFARLTLDLLALGAPATLVAAAQAAAADEIAHAKVAYAFATAYGGTSIGPGPLATPPAAASSIVSLALASLEDGCIGEAWAALTLRARAEAARAAGRTREARALLAIADDEDRHVDLAWRIVDWAVRTAPDEVVPALRAARASLTSSDASPRHERALVDGAVVPCVDAMLASVA